MIECSYVFYSKWITDNYLLAFKFMCLNLKTWLLFEFWFAMLSLGANVILADCIFLCLGGGGVEFCFNVLCGVV